MIEIMYVVTDVFQLLIIYNFAQRMLIRRYTKMFTYLAWVGIFLAGEIPVCFNNSHMVFTVSNILLIVGLGILYRDRIKKKIVVFLYIAIFILFSECITNFLLNTLSFNDNSNDYFVVGSIISKLIFVLLIQIVILFNRNSNDLDMNFGLWLGALIIPVCSIVIMILVYYLRKDIAVGAEDIAIYMVLLLINYVSVVQFDNIQKMIFLDAKNTLLEQQESYYINQCQRTNELWDGTRRFRHDIKNQYIVEQELLNMGKYEELKEKYRTTISSMVKDKKYSETGNIYVDSLINYKGEVIENNGAEFKCDINVPSELPFENNDITLILGNVLDNAIDALNNVSGSRKYCYIKMVYDKPNVIIEVRNNYEGERKTDINGEYITTKDNSVFHGIGLRTIRNVVNKYQGKVDIKSKDNEFVILIHIFKSYI